MEYVLGGGSITTFESNNLPTTGDVLRFYSQFWGVRMSINVKETLVLKALTDLYRSKGINTICELSIIRKIKREIGKLSKILKFKTKKKTPNQIRSENEFRLSLLDVFDITNSESGTEHLETDHQIESEGKITFYFLHDNSCANCHFVHFDQYRIHGI